MTDDRCEKQGRERGTWDEGIQSLALTLTATDNKQLYKAMRYSTHPSANT